MISTVTGCSRKVWILWGNSPSTHARAKSEFYRWAHYQNKPKCSVCKVSNSHYVRATPFCLCWAFCTKSEWILLSSIHDQLVFFPLQHSSPKGSSTSFQISEKNFFGFSTSFQISYCTAQVLHTMSLSKGNCKDWGPSKGAWNTKTLKTSCAPFHFHLKNTPPTLQQGESANMSVQTGNTAPRASERDVQWRVVFITILYSLTVSASEIGYFLWPEQPTQIHLPKKIWGENKVLKEFL